MNRDQSLSEQALALGLSLEGELRIGGRYSPTIRHAGTVHVSGQVPRIGDRVVVTGRAGETVSLEQARRAARICAVRALAFLQRSAGSLDAVQAILRMTVYVQCSDTFTHQSEVADAASDLLVAVLGEAGHHTRTSVGVYQLPKGATVEIDLVAAVEEGA